MSWHPNIEDYHASPEVGSSMLKTFRDSPGLFYGQWVKKSIPRDPPNKAMILGSLMHSLVEAEELVVAQHNGKRVGSRNSKAFRKCAAEHGRLACTGPEINLVTGALEVLKTRNTPHAKLARWLLLECPGKREYSPRWKHNSGEICKVRFDSLPDAGQGLPGVEHSFADLKFVNECTLDAFRRNMEKYGKGCQGALYSQGYCALRGEWPVACFVLIGNARPHPILVTTLSETFIEVGLDLNQQALNGIAECRKSGRWFSEEEISEDVSDLEPSYYFLKRYQKGLEE